MNEKKKPSSVFTKGQVHAMLVALHDSLSESKSVKEAREKVRDAVTQYTPSARGRRLSVDVAGLQAIVDETAPKMVGNSASYLAQMVASQWNVRPNNTNLIDASKVKKMVLSGKLNFPDNVRFQTRSRKQTVVNNAETTTD